MDTIKLSKTKSHVTQYRFQFKEV